MGPGRRFAAFFVVLVPACIAGLPSLSTTEQATMTANPSSLVFNQIEVGSSSTPQTVTLSPQMLGTDDDTITSIVGCSDFTITYSAPLPFQVHSVCSAQTLTGKAPAGTGTNSTCTPVKYSFDVTFTPSTPGQHGCTILVYSYPTALGSGSGASTAMAITASGSGTAPMFALDVTPGSIDFGGIPSNSTSGIQTIRARNLGSTSITVTPTRQTSDQAFTLDTSPFGLAPNASRDLDVTCSQPSAGPHTDTIVFTPSGGTAHSVSLSCTGITSAVEVTPRPASFAPALVGAAPPDVAIAIKNPAAAGSVTLTQIKLSPMTPELTVASKPADLTVLPAGETAYVVLHYSATSPRDRSSLGTLDLTVDGIPQSIGVNGGAEPGAISVSPASLDFGPICAGEKVSDVVAVYASATGAVELSSVTPPAATPPFDVPSVTATLQPLRGNEAKVKVTATGSATGDFADAFVINSNVPDQAMLSVPVHVEVQPAGVGASPASVNFGVQMVGGPPAVSKVVVSNCSGTPLTITDATIETEVADEFAISERTAVIQPKDNHEFVLVMTAKANGTRTGTLVFEHDGGDPTPVPLTGDAFGLGSVDRETYYACSTGRAGSTWPLALALVGISRRRRRRR